jgi:hypothetical protein
VDESAELAAAGSVAASAAVAGAEPSAVVLLLLQPAMPRVKSAAMLPRARACARRALRDSDAAV